MGAIGGILFALGFLLFLVGWIWAVVLGFQKGGALWGILNFLFSPISTLIFCITQKDGWIQFGLQVVGILLYFVGAVLFAIGNPNLFK